MVAMFGDRANWVGNLRAAGGEALIFLTGPAMSGSNGSHLGNLNTLVDRPCGRK